MDIGEFRSCTDKDYTTLLEVETLHPLEEKTTQETAQKQRNKDATDLWYGIKDIERLRVIDVLEYNERSSHDERCYQRACNNRLHARTTIDRTLHKNGKGITGIPYEKRMQQSCITAELDCDKVKSIQEENVYDNNDKG